MAELTPDSAPQVAQVAVKPKGILPANFQNWLMISGGVLVILFILFNSGGSNAKSKKAPGATEPAKTVVVDPSQARIQEYRNKIDTEARKLEAEEQRLKEVQQSMGMGPDGSARATGALQTMYPPPSGPNAMPVSPQNAHPVDPVQADREKREYASLFASNVALSLRSTSAGRTKPEKQKSEGDGETRKKDGDAAPFPSFNHVATTVSNSVAVPEHSSTAAEADPQDSGVSDGPETEKPGKTKGKTPDALGQADGGKYRLFEGTVLETVLTNRLAGDFSGPVNCLVSTNVYSHNRQHLLIPQGSRVLGETKRVTNFGQQRLAVLFHRLIMPDGYSVDLDQFQGLNQIGETGLKDQINHHYVAIFGSSLALGAIAGFSQAGAHAGLVTSGTDSYREGFSSSLSQSSQRILDRFLNQLPTVTIREGYRVKVYLAGDLLLPDYTLHRIPDDL